MVDAGESAHSGPESETFDGETIFLLGRRPAGGEQIPRISDWTTDPADAPLPTTEEGGINSTDDARFDRAPEMIRVRIFIADPEATTLGEYPLFVTAAGDGDYLFARSTVYPAE